MFQDHYKQLPDDQLQLLALRDDLLPEAKDALTKELHVRGLTDLEGFRRTVQQNRAIAKAADSLVQERVWRYELANVAGAIALAAWFCAVAVPMQLLLDPNLENARKPRVPSLRIAGAERLLGIPRTSAKAGRWFFLDGNRAACPPLWLDNCGAVCRG